MNIISDFVLYALPTLCHTACTTNKKSSTYISTYVGNTDLNYRKYLDKYDGLTQ